MYRNIYRKGNTELGAFQNKKGVIFYCSINLLLYSLCNLVFNLVSYLYRWDQIWRMMIKIIIH